MFRINGAPPEAILDKIIKLLAVSWKIRTGNTMKTDDESVKMIMNKIGNGKPFCCHLGDERLKKILVSVTTNVEKKKLSSKPE